MNLPPEQLERLKKASITPEGAPVGPFWVEGRHVMLEGKIHQTLESLQDACRASEKLNEAFHKKFNPKSKIY